MIIPVVGARRTSQLVDSLACTELTLSPAQMARLDAASHIELGFPHDFLNSPFIREVVHAGMYDVIENHRE